MSLILLLNEGFLKRETATKQHEDDNADDSTTEFLFRLQMKLPKTW